MLVEPHGPFGGLNAALNKFVINDKGDEGPYRDCHPPGAEDAASPREPGRQRNSEHADEPPIADGDEQPLAALKNRATGSQTLFIFQFGLGPKLGLWRGGRSRCVFSCQVLL